MYEELAALEQALSRTAFLSLILESLGQGVVVTDAKGGLLLQNPAARELIEEWPEGPMEQIPERLGLRDAAGLMPWAAFPLARALRGEPSDEVDVLLCTPGQAPRELSVTGRPLRNPDGSCAGGVIVFRDVTDRRHVERELELSVRRLDRRNRDLAALQNLSEMMLACQSLEEAGQVIARSLQALLPGRSGSLYLHREGGGLFQERATWGEGSPEYPSLRESDCWALRRGKPYWLEEGGVPCPHQQAGDAPACCIPLTALGEVLGLISLQRLPSNEAAAEYQETLLGGLGEQVALGLSNLKLRERLQEQATRDPLTALHNRRYATDWLTRELARCMRHGRALGAIMIDMDHFKRFNTRFGHAGGDAALRQLATCLATRLRTGDLCCRMGGEEFLLLLPEATLENARERAHELLQAVRELRLLHDGAALGPVTISAGVASYPESAGTEEGLLEAADKALALAKELGRDRVEG